MTLNPIRNFFAKLSAVQLVAGATTCALVFLTSFYFTSQILGGESEEEEEHEGIPSVLKSMDMWTDMRTYPNKELEATQFNSSFELARRMPVMTGGTLSGMNAPTAAGSWTTLAPMNFAGRILSIAFHPTDPNIMWVGAASGGLWKTTNGGRGAVNGINWTYVPTGFAALGISSIVVNPNDPDEIYLGTGEVYNSTPGGATGAGHIRTFRGSYGIGILKTTDGGATWIKTLDFTASNLKGVMDMVINPSDPTIVFAATTDGVYRTTNSGASWTLVHNITYAMDLCYKPGDPNVLYVGSGNFQSSGNGIYKTTNANAVTPTFTKLTSAAFPNPISGKIHLAISANNTSRVYASIGRDPNQTSHVQGLYVSTNEGSTWAAAGATSILGNQGWYAHDVAVSPSNANRVLWGELDTYLSTNGGASMTKTGSWSSWDVNNTTVGDTTEGVSNTTGYVHADVHRITASPHDPAGNTFFLCTDGGLFRTTNGGSAFHTLNGGLNTAQVYAKMAIHPTNSNYMLAGLQDNEAMVYEGNYGCRRIGNLGDGFHAAISSNGVTQVVESYYFNMRRSTNSGSTFGSGSGQVAELACFNVPMVFSRASASTYMFAGTIYFKRSTNSGSTWSNLNGGAAIAGANNPIIAMAAPNNSTVYFSTAPAGGVRSKLWKTTNATAGSPTFTEITGTLPDRYYSSIDVDPIDPNRIFVTLSGFGTSHIYMSLDGGANWSNLGTGLPDVPANCVFVNPGSRTQIYVGNDIGVYVVNNVPTSGPLGASVAASWINFNEGLGDAVMVTDIIATTDSKLRLATYGRGIWERDIASLTLPVTFKSLQVTQGENANKLLWIVGSQSKVRQYDVEWSTDGVQFTKIATVAAKDQTGDISYVYDHKLTQTRDVYYRIKMIDLDGKSAYSTIQVVKMRRAITKTSVYPNPAIDRAMVQFSATAEDKVDLRVYNNAGVLLLHKKESVQKGINKLSVDLRTLASGVYQVVLEGNSNKEVIKLIKQ